MNIAYLKLHIISDAAMCVHAHMPNTLCQPPSWSAIRWPQLGSSWTGGRLRPPSGSSPPEGHTQRPPAESGESRGHDAGSSRSLHMRDERHPVGRRTDRQTDRNVRIVEVAGELCYTSINHLHPPHLPTYLRTSTPVKPQAVSMFWVILNGTFSGTRRLLPFSKHTL